MVDAILLDFYGTVVHEDDEVISAITHEIQQAAATASTAAEISTFWWHEFSAGCTSSRGDSFRTQREIELDSLKATCDRFKADCDPAKLSQRLYDHWQRPPIFPDALEFLSLVEVAVVVVSNIDRADIEHAIEFHGLSFTGVVTSEDVRSYKPNPELFEAGLQLAGVDKSQALAVGDSWSSDVHGAGALGLPVAWVNRTRRQIPDGPHPDHVLDDLKPLIDISRRSD